jgi:hypothetical protein
MKTRGEGQGEDSHSMGSLRVRHLRLGAYSTVGTTERRRKLNVSVKLTP